MKLNRHLHVVLSLALAWILWEKVTYLERFDWGFGNRPQTAWYIHNAHETKAKCERLEYKDALRISPGWVIFAPKELRKEVEQGVVAIATLVCLPDSIDPRSPKGATQ